MIMIMILKHLPVISIVGWLSPLGVIHNDLHPPEKTYNMVLKITKVKKENQIWTRPPIFGVQNVSFQGWINDESTHGECPVWVDENRREVLKLLSYFKKALPMMDLISEQQMRKKEYQSHFRLRKKMLRKNWGGGIVHDDMIFYGIQMDSRGFRKDVSHQTVKFFTVFKPSLNSLSMGGAAHIHVGHLFSLMTEGLWSFMDFRLIFLGETSTASKLRTVSHQLALWSR